MDEVRSRKDHSPTAWSVRKQASYTNSQLFKEMETSKHTGRRKTYTDSSLWTSAKIILLLVSTPLKHPRQECVCTTPASEPALCHDVPNALEISRHRCRAIKRIAILATRYRISPLSVQLQTTLRPTTRTDAAVADAAYAPSARPMTPTSLTLGVGRHEMTDQGLVPQ